MSTPPPGWYPDPVGSGVLRWWDGTVWTDHRAVPAAPPAAPPHPTLPVVVAIGALGAMAVPLVLSRPVLRWMVTWDLPIAVYILLLSVVVYGPSVWWWRFASRRFGTGAPAADIGLRARAADAGWGPLTWLACLGAQLVAALLVRALDIPFEGNTESIRESRTVMAYVIPMLVLTVLVAPLVEEIVFRGLVLRGLLTRLRPAAAIGVQAVVFGAAHVDPGRGAGNIGLVLALSALGAVLGGAAYLTRRLGPSIVAHAIVNSIAMAVALSGWEPPSQ